MDQPDHGVQIHVSIALFVMSSDVCVHPWHVRTLLSCHVTHGMCVPCFHCPLQSIVHLTPLVKLSMGSSPEKLRSNAPIARSPFACCFVCLFTRCLFTRCLFPGCLSSVIGLHGLRGPPYKFRDPQGSYPHFKEPPQ